MDDCVDIGLGISLTVHEVGYFLYGLWLRYGVLLVFIMMDGLNDGSSGDRRSIE